MKYDFQVENIKCGGCSNIITTKLRKIDGVEDVIVKVDDREVRVIAESDQSNSQREALSAALAKLGYPETGSTGSNCLVTKATSFVSCALGKISKKI
ncbi:MAG: heavy-metal-associated domain-containing protein [Gammaproteobacteria bacterium]|nr:heavy-metal-associated domain-containing protein [Gammaproteobacteria bacterium]